MKKIIPAILLGSSCWLSTGLLPAQTDDARSADDTRTTMAPAPRDVKQQPGHYHRWQGHWWYWMPGNPGQWYVYNGTAWSPYRPGMTVGDLHRAAIKDLSQDGLALYAFTGTKHVPQQPESLNPTQNSTPQVAGNRGNQGNQGGIGVSAGGGIIGGRRTGQTYRQLTNRYNAMNGQGMANQSQYQIGGLPGSTIQMGRGGAAANGPNTNLNSSQSQFSQLAGQGQISTVAPGLNTGGTQPPGSPGSPALSNGGQLGAGGTPVGSLSSGGTSAGTFAPSSLGTSASSGTGAGLAGTSGAAGGGTGGAAGSAGAGGPGGGGAAGAGGGGAGAGGGGGGGGGG
ncbi:MAG TPA: hypothetical protein VHB77_19580 [Planctomycetaceae bacterium]|nr:hypothetical protein [Planctomycetaceae bacterium]